MLSLSVPPFVRAFHVHFLHRRPGNFVCRDFPILIPFSVTRIFILFVRAIKRLFVNMLGVSRQQLLQILWQLVT